MAVTRINNNQITDASAGNVYLGINANTKLQNYSITSNKIANNLTYGSDLTVSGNLTVNGTSTAIDTTITTIEDPVIVLASTQTGSPTVDIGFIGERGTANNIAFVWNEANSEFVTAFTSTSETNTTISILSYANLHTNNMLVGGTTSLVGNVIGAAKFTGTVSAGNLSTVGAVTAASTVGGVITGSSVSVTGGVTAASVAGGVITGTSSSVTGAQTAASTVGGVITGSSVSVTGNVNATGNVTAAWLIGNIQGSVNAPGANTQIIFNDSGVSNATSGFTFNKTSNLVTAAGNVNATNFNGNVFGTSVSASGTVTAASTVGGVITGSSSSVTGAQTAASTVGGVITGSSSSVTGTQTAASTVGGVITGSSTSVTGTQTAASTVGGVITGSSTSVTGTQTAASTVGGVITGSSVSVTGNVTAGNTNSNLYGTTVSASGTVTAASTVGGVITGSSSSVTGAQTAASTVGGVITGSSSSVTGTQTAASTVGGVITGSSTSVTGTQTAASTVGGVITGSSVSVTGNVTGGNLVSATVTNPTAMTVSTNAGNINLEPTGNVVINNTYINGLQLTPVQDQDAASKYYVDQTVTTGITIHEAVYAATNTTLATATGGTITYTQPNGVSNGIGAYIQTTGTFTTIDTANVQTVGTRILVKNEANAVFNGVYVYSNATAITRSTDADQYGANSTQEISYNDYFFTTAGNVNAGTAFIVNAPTGTITFGTSNIGFGIFSQSQVYTANTSAGLVLNGTVFSAKVDNNTTAFDGLGNISVKAGANLTTPNIGAATGTSLSVTGTVTAASTVGGVITGSSSSVTGTQTAASTVGGVITGSSSSVTGTQTAASTVGGVITGSSSSVTGTQTAASTVGGVITGSSSSVTGTQTAASTVGGVITGSSVSVTGNVTAGNTNSNLYGTTVSASGTVTAASTVGGVITGSSTSVTGTTTAASVVGGVMTGSSISVSGTVTGVSHVGSVVSVTGNITGGNINTGGTISATGNITANPSSFFIGNGSQLTGVTASTSGFPVTAGTSNIAAATNGNIGVTVAGTSNVLTIASTGTFTTGLSSVTGNITGGNVLTGGLISATGNATSGNILTGGLVSATGTITSSATITGGNLATGGTASATGNITGGNILTGGLISSTGNATHSNVILTSGFIDGPASGRVTVNGSDLDTDFAVDGDTVANVFYVDAGTGTASFGASTQVTNAIVNFAVTNSIKLPVGNIGQRPATGVTGMVRFNTTNNNLEVYDNSQWSAVGVPSFTVIADEQFNGDGTTVAFTLSSTQTTNSCIVSINGVVQIPTIAYSVSGTNPTCVLTFTEAPATGDLIDVREITTTTTVTSISNSSGNAVVAVSDTAAQVNVTGDLSVSGTILGGNINSTAITSGTSNMAIVSSGGNIRGNVAGTTVMTISPGLVDIVGNLTVSGNATLSGNILGDRIQNGTTSIDIQTPNGNANITVGSTSNVAVFGSTIVTLAANMVPSANITYDLGTTTQRWKDLWLSNSTIYMGNAQISANATSLIFTNPAGGQTVLAGATASITGASVSVTGTVTAASVVGGVITGSSTSVTGTTTAASVVGGVMTGTSLSASGNITGGNLNVSGNIVDTGALSIITGSNGNIDLSPNGTGNVNTGANISVTGRVTAASVVGGVITGSSTSVTGAQTAASTVGGVITGSSTSVTGTTTAASVVGGVITGSSTSVTGTTTAASVVGGVMTGSSVSVSGAVTGASLTTAGTLTVNSGGAAIAIVNGSTDGIGNIGTSGDGFNTVFAKATSAQYADLAEKYTADAEYTPGTVVVFGGTHEVTVNATDADRKVAGVVSTNPAYIMNDRLDSEFTATVALTGRVPCMVVGPVRKGDMMVAAGLGRARTEANPQVGTVIGKALEDFDGAEGVIEVVVGRF